MQTYGVRDLERVLRLSRSALRGLISGGFVTPSRGPRRQYRFSFQDLIVLRTAQALTQAKLSRRHISRSLKDLRHNLPESMPLSGLNICAVGDQIVVRDGKSRYRAGDGQYLLELDMTVADGVLEVVERKPEAPAAGKPAPVKLPPAANAADWFEQALELEDTNPRAAQAAYQRVTTAAPEVTAAWVNWGRLLHEQGRMKEAEKIYRRALQQCGPDPMLLFNLGVLQEDLGEARAAVDTYQNALAVDPNLADCHYNLARLYESMGQPQHAIRHLGQYRRLLNSETR